MIVKQQRAWMNKDMPKSGNVHLFAHGQANDLYKQYGFMQLSTWMPYFSVGIGLNLKRCVSQSPAALRVGGHRSGSRSVWYVLCLYYDFKW